MFVAVGPNHKLPVPVTVQVPLPIFNVLTPVPETLRLPPGRHCPQIVILLLFTLKSKIQPVVEAVQAPMVKLAMLGFVFTVMVQVVPPVQVAASKITLSTDPGTDAPVAPPLEVDHIAVDDASQVHVVGQMPKRLAALALHVRTPKMNRLKSRRFITLPSLAKQESCH